MENITLNLVKAMFGNSDYYIYEEIKFDLSQLPTYTEKQIWNVIKVVPKIVLRKNKFRRKELNKNHYYIIAISGYFAIDYWQYGTLMKDTKEFKNVILDFDTMKKIVTFVEDNKLK